MPNATYKIIEYVAYAKQHGYPQHQVTLIPPHRLLVPETCHDTQHGHYHANAIEHALARAAHGAIARHTVRTP